MELFRDEYEAKQPRKWGIEIYKRLEKRKHEGHTLLAPKPHIKAALEAVPTMEGPLDASTLLETFSDDDLCDVFMRLPNCKTLILQNWVSLSDKVLRCICMHMGPSITELDISGSHVSAANLEILMAQAESIRVLRINRCPRFDTSCMLQIARSAHNTLHELYAEGVPTFRYEPLQALCGFIGLDPPKVTRLRVLDLKDCPLEDVGLQAIASCNHHIKHLNLSGCSTLTDKSVAKIVEVSKHLEVLNLKNLARCTDKVVHKLSTHAQDITSLNLNGLSRVTNDAIVRLLHSCPKIQALNVAGMRHLTETFLAEVCLQCKGILMLNITGCGLITDKGLRAAIQGLPYVEQAETFFGFKPVEGHIERKLEQNMEQVLDTAASRITRLLTNAGDRIRMREEFATIKRDQSARRIQGCLTRYMCRQVFHHKAVARRAFFNVTEIQRVMRGAMGRVRALRQREIMQEFWDSAIYALMIQRCFRGHKVRRIRFDVALHLRLMYINRKVEADTGVAVRFQAGARRFLTRQRIRAIHELKDRRGLDEFNAALTLQCAGRVYNAKKRVIKVYSDRARYHEIRSTAATRIQHFYKAVMGHFKARQSKSEQKMAAAKRQRAAMKMCRVYRGHCARQRVRRRRIRLAERYWAAMQVQRVWRGSRIMHWRSMRINTIAAYVLDRQYLERRERIASSRMRYKQFLADNRKDSASDADEEEEPDEGWEERFDALAKRKYWYSKRLDQATYDEPMAKLMKEKALIGMRVRVYWVVQELWYEGTATRFNRRKHRHKVEYDDGDTEWIDLDEERDRVQVQDYDGSWVMLLMYQPPGAADEFRKETEKDSRDKFKKQAWKDATQWEIIHHDDEKEDAYMYISETTGEIRAGAAGCTAWVIQDDGHGFPCFFNENSSEVVYEDPRFNESPTADMQAQRDFVMQELRYATYFCKELWERYYATFKGYSLKKGGENSTRKTRFMASMIRKSDKPRHLVAFLVRAKNLFKQSSVVDVPSDPGAIKEIEYATWLTERLAEVIEGADNEARRVRDVKFDIVQRLKAKGEMKVYCRFCKRETKRHLDFCPTCGHKQSDLIKEGDADDPALQPDDSEASVAASMGNASVEDDASIASALFAVDDADNLDEENGDGDAAESGQIGASAVGATDTTAGEEEPDDDEENDWGGDEANEGGDDEDVGGDAADDESVMSGVSGAGKLPPKKMVRFEDAGDEDGEEEEEREETEIDVGDDDDGGEEEGEEEEEDD